MTRQGRESPAWDRVKAALLAGRQLYVLKGKGKDRYALGTREDGGKGTILTRGSKRKILRFVARAQAFKRPEPEPAEEPAPKLLGSDPDDEAAYQALAKDLERDDPDEDDENEVIAP